ncbi:hypothetical protein Dcar01_02363 [Deinococcus carri]|uniref:Uncharacterized protein n=1 Tax=Deinococcus carri TaxID=1211323 RepID=A0ABP9W8H8_9DEIO
MSDPLPAEYLLLSAFSLTPLEPIDALKAARLWAPEQQDPTNEQRDLLHELHRIKGQIRWVRARKGKKGEQEGYILTPAGTDALATYWTEYGPAHTRRVGPSLGEIARQRLAEQCHQVGAA